MGRMRIQLSGNRLATEDLVRALALTTRFGDRTVLDGVDLAIRQGEVFVIMGPSGCGKTTLLRNLSGLHQPDFGAVTVGGHDLYAADAELLQHLRLRTGLSFQGGATGFDTKRTSRKAQPSSSSFPSSVGGGSVLRRRFGATSAFTSGRTPPASLGMKRISVLISKERLVSAF